MSSRIEERGQAKSRSNFWQPVWGGAVISIRASPTRSCVPARALCSLKSRSTWSLIAGQRGAGIITTDETGEPGIDHGELPFGIGEWGSPRPNPLGPRVADQADDKVDDKRLEVEVREAFPTGTSRSPRPSQACGVLRW